MVSEAGIISQHVMFDLAGITRSEYRGWRNLLAPVADVQAKHPTYSAAQTLAICVLAELMHVLDCGAKHLVPISQDFFTEICSGDWRRFEHRRLVVQIDQELNANKKEILRLTFRTIPKADLLPDPGFSILVTLQLAPFVHRVAARLTGIPMKSIGQQKHSLEEHQRRHSKSGIATKRSES